MAFIPLTAQFSIFKAWRNERSEVWGNLIIDSWQRDPKFHFKILGKGFHEHTGIYLLAQSKKN